MSTDSHYSHKIASRARKEAERDHPNYETNLANEAAARAARQLVEDQGGENPVEEPVVEDPPF